ncbi:MAG: FUSC family protein [Synechococcaceae cyanobacterium]|nr:FUSC family protein [Synechococcaceae cyanobacterium]
MSSLRYVLAVALVSALSWSLAHVLGLGSATPYGVIIAALLISPDLKPPPKPLLVVLPVVVAFGLGLGTALKPLLGGPQVWQFAAVTVIAQSLGQALPDRLMVVRNLLAVLAVLPLLGSHATWQGAWQQLLAVLLGMVVALLLGSALRPPADAPTGMEGPPATSTESTHEAHEAQDAKASPASGGESEPSRSLAQRFADPFFWRKLGISTLALSIGMGVGAVTPKYLYFGVVLLLNDSLGATLLRVRDRMVGVSLGVLMPLIVFNTLPINAVSVGLVMGGTAALLPALGLAPHLRTALISSGVTFVGYGALTDWYVPHRWLDYLLGSGLALLVCLLVRPTSALRRFQRLAESEPGLTPALQAVLPSAREEARVLGQEQEFRALLERLKASTARQV